MTNGFSRMPIAPEMNSLQAEIGSNQRLMTGGDLQDCAIVSDTGGNPSPSGRPTPNARDQ
jgi:hypothetical protein